MSHMIADTKEELFQMVEKVGLPKKHYQPRASFPHFDVMMSTRAKAVAEGAVELTNKQLIEKIRELRLTDHWKAEIEAHPRTRK
jgi:hypothetical protein